MPYTHPSNKKLGREVIGITYPKKTISLGIISLNELLKIYSEGEGLFKKTFPVISQINIAGIESVPSCTVHRFKSGFLRILK